MLRSIDGGETVRAVAGGGWDYHDVWLDPEDPGRVLVASDAGVSMSRDGGATFRRPPLPISQFYHLSVDTRRPYRVLGSLQDWGTVSGPSRSLHSEGILLSDWHPVGGGEAGHVVADPDDPEVVWAGEYLGIITRWDGRLRRGSHVGIYPHDGSGHAAADLRYRFQWTAPIVISPHDSRTVYHAANVLLRTRDGGQSWEAISPDLTRDDPSKQSWSGGPITGDNTGVEFYGTIFAVAESPVTPGLLWVGTDDGLVQVSRDGGESWQEVTPPGAPEWGTVACIEASRRDAGTAWVVYDAHRLDDESPYLFSTTDHGASWSNLSTSLEPEIYLHVIREDPEVAGMLYLGTERGVTISRDAGRTFEPLRLNLPTVAVVDLALAGGDLVVGTLGRSAWILDDLTPVQQMSAAIGEAEAHLFPPRATRCWRIGDPPDGSREGAAANPPDGALLTYFLREAPEAEVSLVVRDAAGAEVRRLSSVPRPPYVEPGHPDRDPEAEDEAELPAEAGLNRAAWDLRYAGPERVPGALLDWGDPGAGPLVLPGEYTLELEVGDTTLRRKLTVLPDPRLTLGREDRQAQLDFALAAATQFSRVSRLVQQVRAVLDQLADRERALAGQPRGQELVRRGKALAVALGRIEEALHNPRAEVGYDILAGRAGGARLHSQLGWLFMIARDHEGPPTQGMREQAKALGAELAGHEAEVRRLFEEELASLNEEAAREGMPWVVLPE
jgi:photosystem II stability/assembly factor-like uncharacterized protein